MTLLHRPAVQRWLAGHLLCRVAGAGPHFALTFDDGPSPHNTPLLLDVLARHGAHATFFVIARRARRRPELIRRMVAEGHEVGIHGDWHVPAWSVPRGWLTRDLAYAAAAVRDACGREPRHFRAPFGLMFPLHARWVRAAGLIPVLGSIYPRDHAVRRPEVTATRVMARLGSGDLVILHDASALGDHDRGPTIAAVDRILAEAARGGMRSRTVAELVAATAEDQVGRG